MKIKVKDDFGFKGWNKCIYLTNDKIEVVVTTEVGPRIIRFGFTGGQNLFGEIKEQLGKSGGDEWRIYGGHRLWHAPEANPRTYYPDNEPIEYEIKRNNIRLIQNVENTTGIQKEMEIRLDADTSEVVVLHRINNKTLWDIELAPWAISVMNLGGRAIIPQEPFQSWDERLTPVRPLVLWGYTDMSDPRWIWGKKYIQLRQDPNLKTRQKIGVLNTLGWVAYYLKGELFVKRYDYDKNAQYPDFGVNTEVYTDSDILEVETLGKLEKIPPGGFVEHIERWFLFKVELDETEESIDENVLPLIKSCYPAN